jgi:hypothetical protein
MKTIARVYDTYGQARDVVADLEAAGIAASDIDVIANKAACEEAAPTEAALGAGAGAGFGAALGGAAGLLAGLGVLAIPGLGPVVAVGTLAATAIGAVAGAATGGIVGALVEAGVPEEEAQVYCEAVRRGGTMVSVRGPADRERLVLEIMARHRPVDHAARAADYRGGGWTRFDPAAEPHLPARAARERGRAG